MSPLKPAGVLWSLILILLLSNAAGANALFVVAGGGGAKYKNVVAVAKSGAPFTSIQAALDSITDASSDNRYLVVVAPGTYQEQVQLKEWVDVRGASRQSTVITYQGSNTQPYATVTCADNCELSNLTVANTGGDYTNASGISVPNEASPRLNHLDITISSNGADYVYGISSISWDIKVSDIYVRIDHTGGGQRATGISFASPYTLTVRDTTVEITSASGTGNLIGVCVIEGRDAMLRGLEVRVTGNPNITSTQGIAVEDDSQLVYFDNRVYIRDSTVTLKEAGEDARGIWYRGFTLACTNVSVLVDNPAGTNNYGVHSQIALNLIMRDMDIRVDGTPSGTNTGVYLDYTSARFHNMDIEINGAGNQNLGVDTNHSSADLKYCSITVDDSASTAMGILNQSGTRPRIAYSDVQGGHVGLRNTNADSTGDPIIVFKSSLKGSTASLINEANYDTYLTGCILEGVVDIQGGTVACGDCYDQSTGAVTCP